MFEVLYLEKRGCNFWDDDTDVRTSDVGNYRVCTPCENIPGKNGKMYFIELTHWKRYNYRNTHKISGKPLKHEVKELENANALYFDSEYTENGLTFGDLKLNDKIRALKLSYTQSDILKAVNIISRNNYKEILFSDSQIIKDIKKSGGYREKKILENIKSVKVLQDDGVYKVYSFEDTNGNTFDYEKNGKNICG